MEASTAALGVIAGTALPTSEINGGTTLSGGTTTSIAPISTRYGGINNNTAGIAPQVRYGLSSSDIRSIL